MFSTEYKQRRLTSVIGYLTTSSMMTEKISTQLRDKIFSFSLDTQSIGRRVLWECNEGCGVKVGLDLDRLGECVGIGRTLTQCSNWSMINQVS